MYICKLKKSRKNNSNNSKKQQTPGDCLGRKEERETEGDEWRNLHSNLTSNTQQEDISSGLRGWHGAV